MPLPGSRVIHDRFEEHHRATAEGGQTGTCVIDRYSTAGAMWDDETMRTTYPDPELVYTGKARVQRQSQAEVPVDIGSRRVVIRTYTVSIPADAPEIRISDRVVVTGVADTMLPDAELWVHDVWMGSLVWERDLVCRNAPPTQR